MTLVRNMLIGIGVGAAGAGAFLLFSPSAMATEDETGTTVPPSQAPRPQVVLPAPGTIAAADSLGLKAVEVLSRYVGAKEDPPKSNRGPVVDRINLGVYGDGARLVGKPWCARAVRFAYEKAAQELGLPRPFANVGTLAYVTDWRSTFKNWEMPAPTPGDVALILHGGVRHATLVSRVDPDGTVWTVEGNHSDSVANVKRPASAFDDFIDVTGYARRGQDVVSGSGLDDLVRGSRA